MEEICYCCSRADIALKFLSYFLSPLHVKLMIQLLRIIRNSLGSSCLPLSAVSLHILFHLTGIVLPS